MSSGVVKHTYKTSISLLKWSMESEEKRKQMHNHERAFLRCELADSHFTHVLKIKSSHAKIFNHFLGGGGQHVIFMVGVYVCP